MYLHTRDGFYTGLETEEVTGQKWRLHDLDIQGKEDQMMDFEELGPHHNW